MSGKTAIEFVRANAPYSPGDIITLPEGRAAVFVAGGAARYCRDDSPEEKPMAEKKTAVVTKYQKKG